MGNGEWQSPFRAGVGNGEWQNPMDATHALIPYSLLPIPYSSGSTPRARSWAARRSARWVACSAC